MPPSNTPTQAWIHRCYSRHGCDCRVADACSCKGCSWACQQVFCLHAERQADVALQEQQGASVSDDSRMQASVQGQHRSQNPCLQDCNTAHGACSPESAQVAVHAQVVYISNTGEPDRAPRSVHGDLQSKNLTPGHAGRGDGKLHVRQTEVV